MTVKHIVMFGFKEGTTEDDLGRIKAALLALPKEIPTILSFELGEDLLLESGQKHPAGKNRRICWSACFGTSEAFEAYQSHPAHQAFINLLKTVVEPGSRAAIQYGVAAP